MEKQIKLLDCTLRDGGYYNNWQFETKDANRYLKQVYTAGIDVVEIGFYFFEKDKNYGKFAFVDSNVVKHLVKSKKTKLAVMINGSDFLKIKDNYKSFLNKVFKKKELDFSIIRIASHYRDVPKLIKYIKHLKFLRYNICFNLMQINNVKKIELKRCLKKLNSSNSVDVFYFADSFGNLKPKNIRDICKTIKEHWKKEIGIHSHDNCGLALKNSVQAYKSGVTWIDGTIQGMGRGAGNAKTESLLKYFSKYNYKLASIKNISNKYFYDLKKKYKWGKSNYYKIAAKYNIHPTYIQMLQTDNRYKKGEILSSIDSLKRITATSFDPKRLEKLFTEKSSVKGKWNAKGWCLNKSLLILGQGPSLEKKENINKIKDFILKTKCIVLSININNLIPTYLIDFYIASNETRISVDSAKYNNLSKKIIVPELKLKKIKRDYKKINYLDYGVTLKNNLFKHYTNYAVLPHNLTFGYAMAVALEGQSKNITIAGFDGYKKNQLQQIEMQKTINLILQNNKSLNLKSLTSTKYILNRRQA
jgi:4-hydroxy 2-oxovalerate aldolase